MRERIRECFQTFCSDKLNRDVFGQLKRIKERPTYSGLPTKLNKTNLILTDREEVIDHLLQSFFQDEKPLGPLQENLKGEVLNFFRNGLNEEIPPVTANELNSATNTLKDGSAPGEDGINIDILKTSLEALQPILLAIFNACLTHKHFPGNWKLAKLCIIRKPNKEGYEDVKSYRPICILNSLGKILESVILQRISWLSQKFHWFSHRKHAFLPDRSTESAVHCLTTIVENNLARGTFTASLFLDIAGAFDSAWGPAIVAALIQKGCPKYLCYMVQSFLADRRVSLQAGHYRRTKSAPLGCPQGGVLSPFLWNIMLDCVIRIEFAFSHEIIAYADDLLLLSYDFHCCTAVSNLQAMTDYFVYSLSSLMLQINARKSVFILFNRKKRPLPPLAIVIDQTSVCPSESTKYIGFEIDSKLTWRKHIEQRCASTIRVINDLRRYLRLTWGVDTNNLKILYKSVVLPTL